MELAVLAYLEVQVVLEVQLVPYILGSLQFQEVLLGLEVLVHLEVLEALVGLLVLE